MRRRNPAWRSGVALSRGIYVLGWAGIGNVVAEPAPFAGYDVLIVRRHRRWAWGSREGEEAGEVVVVEVEAEAEAESEQEAAEVGRRGAARRGARPRSVGSLN